MRRAFSASVALAVVSIAAGCDDTVSPPISVATVPTLSRLAEACYAVSGTIDESFKGADFANGIFFFGGPVTGDLEGTSLSGLTASDKPAGDPPGPLGFGAGTSTITVTGGSIPSLTGASLVFDLEQVSRTAPPIVTTNQSMTLRSGARRGNLTVHGTFDFATFSSTSTYRGSICP